MKSLYRELKALEVEKNRVDSRFPNVLYRNADGESYKLELEPIIDRGVDAIERYSKSNPVLRDVIAMKREDMDEKPLVDTLTDYTCSGRKALPGAHGRHFKRVNRHLKRILGKSGFLGGPLEPLFFPRLTQKAYDKAAARKVDFFKVRAEYVEEQLKYYLNVGYNQSDDFS